MELFLLYLWLKLDTIVMFLTVGLALLGAGGFLGWIWTTLPYYEAEAAERRKYWKPIFYRKVVPVLVGVGFLTSLIPTQTQTAILVGGHFALKAIESPEAAKIASVLRKKANEMLDKELAK